MDCGIGARVYSNDLDVSFSIRLLNSAIIFQAEVLGIEKKKADEVLLNNYGTKQKIIIYNHNSQAALVALSTPQTNSNIVNNCRKA